MQNEVILKIPLIIGIIVSFSAMITDMTKGKIFNWLTFPAIALGWMLNFYLNGLTGLGYSVVATFVGILMFLPAALIGMVGMGDVKLLAALGAIGGTNYAITVFLYASVLGLPHAIIIQLLNYGKDSFMMLITSFSSGAVFEKNIHKENLYQAKTGKYRFLLGIDLFVATIIAWFYIFNFTW